MGEFGETYEGTGQLMALELIPPIDEQIFTNETLTLEHLPSWQHDLEEPVLFVGTNEKGYGRLVKPNKWQFVANTLLQPAKQEEYPAAVVLSDEYLKSRVDIRELLETLNGKVADGSMVYVLEKPGQDHEIKKRLRILKEKGFVNPHVIFTDLYTVWTAQKPIKTEALTLPEKTNQITNLELSNVSHVPDEIQSRGIFQNLPDGDILVVDTDNARTGTIYGKNDLSRPRGKFNLDQPQGKRFSSVVFKSSHPLEKNSISPQILSEYTEILRRQNPKKDTSGNRITDERCGGIFVYEQKGDDHNRDWRIELLSEAGLVEANVLKGRSNKQPIIWEARLKKEAEREGINLEQVSKNKEFDYVSSFRLEGNQNITLDNLNVKRIDDTRIMKRIRNSKFIPRDLYDLKHGLDRDIEFFCGCIWEVYSNGTKRPQRLCQEDNCPHKTPPVTEQTFDHSAPLKSLKQNRNESRPSRRFLDPTIEMARQNPGRMIKTEMKCFDCKSNLYRKVETVEQPDGSRKNMLFNICVTHGQRGYARPV